jgi:hypothetical protein
MERFRHSLKNENALEAARASLCEHFFVESACAQLQLFPCGLIG